jgi:outer membrane protein OmpA-like peptidoglycan-associated protein
VLIIAQGEVEKLPQEINTIHYDESSPVLSRDGGKLFFTRTADPGFESTLMVSEGQWVHDKNDADYEKQLANVYSAIAGKKVKNPVASVLNQDIWYATLKGDSVDQVIHPGYPLNNALPNSLVSTGKQTDEFILLNEFYEDGSMYAGFSRVTIDESGEHTFPEPIHIYGFHLIRSDVNMTMTPNGHVLILSMQGHAGTGAKDLYVSFYMRDNVWSYPVHMGPVLNSSSQETTPYITADKRYLYFSSDRPGGDGGNDLYVSERLDYTWLKWSEPKKLSDGVNSKSDESQPYFDSEGRFMYFTSRRDGTSDIFRQRLTPKPKLKGPIVIQGRIVNTETGKQTRGEIFWGPTSAKDYLEYFNSYNGEFEAVLTEFEPYKFQLRKPNHEAHRILIDPRLIEQQGKDTLDVTFFLKPKTQSIIPPPDMEDSSRLATQFIDLESAPSSFYDIYFVRSEATMMRKSINALNELWHTLQSNPGMEIMIIGHTDNVGDDGALVELSLRRAEAVQEYLELKGIAAERLQVRGMGASKPLYDNATENGRQKNRRVEIKTLRR